MDGPHTSNAAGHPALPASSRLARFAAAVLHAPARRHFYAGLHGWRADLAAALLGVLSGLALPPLHVLPVLLVALPALLALLDGARNPRVAFRRGFWFGFGHHLVGLYWITEAILVEAARFWWLVPLAVPALSVVLALFIAAACWAARLARPGWDRLFALAGAWVLADLARQFIATGFPWNPWGADWAVPGRFGDVFIQPAAWVSVHGLTLATLLIAGSPALGRRGIAWGAAGLAAWAALGLARLEAPAPAAPDLSVVLVQGNVAQGEKWNRAIATDIFNRYLALTRQGLAEVPAGRARLVVWPESASPWLLDRDAGAREAIAEVLDGAPALIGSVRIGADGRPRNSAMALLGPGPPLATYDKWHLVPFGEYAPSWLPLPIQVVPGGGFAAGPGPRTLHVPGLPALGPLICYEAIFPGQAVARGDRPSLMVNITNDAWFGNSTGPRQHLAAARLRAVEEGLPLLRAANTGITAEFDASGHEVSRLPMQRAGVLTLAVPGALPPTIFARFGLLVPLALALMVLGGGLISLTRRR